MSFILIFILCLISTFLGCIIVKREDYLYRINHKEYIILILHDIFISIISWLLLQSNIGIYPSVFYSIFFSVLSISVIIDYKLQELPDTITYFACVFSLMYLLSTYHGNYIVEIQIIIAIIYFTVSTILSLIGTGLGFGDAKLLIVIGLLSHPAIILKYWIITLSLSLIHIFLKVIKYLIQSLKNKKYLNEIKEIKIAFGPYLIYGLAITMALNWMTMSL